MWTHCSMGMGTWWQRTLNSLRCLIPCSAWSLLARWAFSNLCPETCDTNWNKEDLTSVEDQVGEYVNQMDKHNLDLAGMHPWVLRKLVATTATPLLNIFERSWQIREVSEAWKKGNVNSIFKKGKNEDPRNYRPVSLTSIPRKVREQMTLKAISKHMKDKQVVGDKHEFIEGKPDQTNRFLQWNDLVGEGKMKNVFYLDFSKDVMDTGTECTLSKSADYTKQKGVADTPEGCPSIQTNLNRMEKWTKRPWSSAKGNAKSCIWEGIIPWTSTGWGLTSQKAVLQTRTWWTRSWTWTSNVLPKQKKNQPTSWTALERVLQIDGSDPLPLFSTGEGTPGGLCPALGCQLKERHDNVGKSSASGLKDD